MTKLKSQDMPPILGLNGGQLTKWAVEALNYLRTTRDQVAADSLKDFFDTCSDVVAEHIAAVEPHVESAVCPYQGRDMIEVRFNTELRGAELPKDAVSVLGCTVQGVFIYGHSLLVYCNKRVPMHTYVTYTPQDGKPLETTRGEVVRAFNKAVL